MNRKDFLKRIGLAAVVAPALPLIVAGAANNEWTYCNIEGYHCFPNIKSMLSYRGEIYAADLAIAVDDNALYCFNGREFVLVSKNYS